MGSDEKRLINLYPNPVKESTGGGFLGDLEYAILSHYVESGFVVESLSSIARSIRVDVRRVYDAVKRLVSRGFLERVKRGTYRLTEVGERALAVLGVRRLSGKARQGNGDGTGGAKVLPDPGAVSRRSRPSYGGEGVDREARPYVVGEDGVLKVPEEATPTAGTFLGWARVNAY